MSTSESQLGLAAATQDAVAYINGKRFSLPPGRGEVTLLQYLRENGLTGTKLGCGEGGCGACTVMLSSCEDGKIVHRSVNACLCPLYAIEGMHVITVEGIGNVRQGLHPVQEALSKGHGSQCGFCTPGFVMSMYALLRSSETAPTEEEVEDALGGNLCRCTGYRPILDAFKTFTKSDPKAYTEEAIAASRGLPYGNGSSNGTNSDHATASNGTNGSNGGSVCPSSGLPCDCKANGGGCGAASSAEGSKAPPPPARPSIDPIFPAELKKRTPGFLHMPGRDGRGPGRGGGSMPTGGTWEQQERASSRMGDWAQRNGEGYTSRGQPGVDAQEADTGQVE